MATAFTAASDPVFDLLRLPFSKRSFGEKTDLTSRGRPTPKPDGLTQAGKGFVWHFTECNYSRLWQAIPDRERPHLVTYHLHYAVKNAVNCKKPMASPGRLNSTLFYAYQSAFWTTLPWQAQDDSIRRYFTRISTCSEQLYYGKPSPPENCII